MGGKKSKIFFFISNALKMLLKGFWTCFGYLRFSRSANRIQSSNQNPHTKEKKPPPSPSGRTPAGEAYGEAYTVASLAIVSDYWLVAKRFHTSPCPFQSIWGGSKFGVRSFVTLFIVRRTSYRRKSPFGFGFFLIDRARSLVVHHLVWVHLVKWFGRGGHRRDRRLRSHV